MTTTMTTKEAAAGALLSVEKARAILAICKRVDEAKDIRDKAVAVATYLRVKKASDAARDDAFEIALRAERRMGQLLVEQGAKQGRPTPAKTAKGTVYLKDIGVSKEEASTFKRVAKIDEEEFDKRVRAMIDKDRRAPTSKRLIATTASSTHDGDSWMTPDDLIARVHRVLGAIDLDPASTPEANNVVKARAFFTKEQDGLSRPWKGRVFLNPPYSHSLVQNFVMRLMQAHETGAVPAAILLVNSATDVSWFQELMLHFMVCFTSGRIAFVQPGGKTVKGNMYGQAFVFLNCDRNKIRREFGPVGAIVGPLR